MRIPSAALSQGNRKYLLSFTVGLLEHAKAWLGGRPAFVALARVYALYGPMIVTFVGFSALSVWCILLAARQLYLYRLLRFDPASLSYIHPHPRQFALYAAASLAVLMVGYIAALVNAPVRALAAAGINSQMNFQGRLLNSSGAVVPDGNYNIEFKIYQDGPGNVAGDTGGTLKWTEDWVYGSGSPDNRVVVRNGYFSVNLGSLTSLSTVDFNSDTLWLSMNIGNTSTAATFAGASGDGEMLPMKRLTANPYAFNSAKLQGLGASNFVQLAQGVQTDSSTSAASIFVNKTGTTANILDLQRGGQDVMLINNAGQVTFQPQTDSATALQVNKYNGGSPLTVFDVDTTNQRVGINTNAPAYALDVVGQINVTQGLRVATNDTWISGVASDGSTVNLFKVNSSNEIQAGAAINVDGGILLPADAGQVTFSDLPISTSTANNTPESYTLRVGSSNALTVYGEADGAGNAKNIRVAVGSSITPAYTLDVGGDINTSTALRVAGTTVCNSSGCTPISSSNSYIQNQNAGPQSSSSFYIDGTGRADTSLQAPLIIIPDGSGHNATISSVTQANSVAISVPADTNTTETLCLQTLANCSGGGVATIGALDGGTYSANGASISGTTMYLQSATGTHVGLVTTGTQTFGGDKTITGVLNVQGTGTSTFGGEVDATDLWINSGLFSADSVTNEVVAGSTFIAISGEQVQGSIDSYGGSTLNIGPTSGGTATAISLNQNTTIAAGKSLTVTGGITATRPASPSKGQLYFDTTTNQLIQYNGTKWVGDHSAAIKIVASSNGSSQAEIDAADYVADGNTGAANDGDQIQINQALNDVGTAGGGTVFLMPGTYTVDASISIPNNVTLAGSGDSSFITIPNAWSTSINIITNSDTSTGTGITIKDLALDGNDATWAGGFIAHTSIYLDHMGGSSSNLTGAKVTGIKFTGMGHTGSDVYLNTSAASMISNNTFYGSDYGVDIENSSALNTVSSNTFYQNTSAVVISSSVDNTVTGNTMSEMTIEGVDLYSADGNTISGNVMSSSNSGSNAVLLNSSNRNNIDSNNIEGGNGEGIYVISGAHNSITGNNLSNTVQYGIDVEDSDNIITGNNVSDSGDTTSNEGIYISGSNSQISGNHITDSSCTSSCYAIDIASGSTNYLSNNTFSGDGTNAATINDGGTGTVYANQQDSSGNLVVKPYANGSLSLQGTPYANANSSLFQIGNAISGGNAVANGGTYIGLNAPNTGAGSAADFINIQKAGNPQFTVDKDGNIYGNSSLYIAGSLTSTISGGLDLGATATDYSLRIKSAPPANSGEAAVQLSNNLISGGNANGTYLGLNAPSSGAGSAADYLNFQQNGVSHLKVDQFGVVTGPADNAFILQSTSGFSLNLTSTAGIILSGDTSLQSGKSLTFSGGASNFDQSSSSGTFKTGTGAVSLNGDTAVSGSHTFATGTGNVGLNGNSTVATGKSFTVTAGNVAYTKGADYATIGSTNDVNLGSGELFRLTGASAQTITGFAGGSDGRLLTIVNAAAQGATLANNSASSAAGNRILTGTGADLTIAANASMNLVYDSGSSVWRVVGGTGSGTGTGVALQDAYTNSAGASPSILLSNTFGGITIQDAASSSIGSLFSVQNNGGTKSYFSVASSGLLAQSSVGDVLQVLFTGGINSGPELRVYDSNASNYATISYDAATNTAIFAASSGTTQIGTGSGSGGDINLILTNPTDSLAATHTTTATANVPGSYSDYSFTRGITGPTYNLQGNVFKIEDLSSVSTGTNSPNLLYINQNNSSAGGNLIQAQTGGTTTRFQVDTSGNASIGANLNVGTVGLLVNGAKPTDVSAGGATTGTTPYQTYVQGRYAYVVNEAGNTLQVFDVSNPASPTSVGSVATGTNPISVSVQGHYAYVVDYGGAKLQVFDVSNPSSPTDLTSGGVATAANPRAIYIQGKHAYVVDNSADKLQIFDISNPASPVDLTSGGVATSANPHGVYVQGRYAYVVNDNPVDNLQIFDISNPASPSSAGTVATGSMPYAVYVQGRYAYVVDQSNDRMEIIDVANPASPSVVSTVSTGTSSFPAYVYVQDHYAYVVNSGPGNLMVIDISNPASPVDVSSGGVTTGGSPTSVFVQGRYVYVTPSGANKLQVFSMGGTYVQQLEAGGGELGTLAVNGDGAVNGDLSVQGGATVGSSLNVSGGFSAGNGLLSVSVSNSLVQIGSATSHSSNPVQLVLDNYNNATDPAGTNGAMYYNASLGKFRCYENGSWANCIGGGVMTYLGGTTLSSSSASLSVSLSPSKTYVHCTYSLTGISTSKVQKYLTFNNDTTTGHYEWAGNALVGASSKTASKSTSDGKINLTQNLSANAQGDSVSDFYVNSFAGQFKTLWSTNVDTALASAEPDIFWTTGEWEDTSSQISSVQLAASTGTFGSGSSMFCEGRDYP